MTVSKLIEQLLTLPQDAKVFKTSCDGCPECNPEGIPYYHDVNAPEFKTEGEYPYQKERNVVTL